MQDHIVQCPCSSLHGYMHPLCSLSLYCLQKYYFAGIHIVSYSKLVAKWRGGKIKLLIIIKKESMYKAKQKLRPKTLGS